MGVEGSTLEEPPRQTAGAGEKEAHGEKHSAPQPEEERRRKKLKEAMALRWQESSKNLLRARPTRM